MRWNDFFFYCIKNLPFECFFLMYSSSTLNLRLQSISSEVFLVFSYMELHHHRRIVTKLFFTFYKDDKNKYVNNVEKK